MSKKSALITGVTGQDGAYLAQLLLDKGYDVHGIKRRSSSFNSARIDSLYQDPHEKDVRFHLHYGDMTDSTNLIRIVQETQPDEIYNLAAQSHVQVSFETPEYTANSDALGTLRLLEAIRILKLEEKTRFYQASTSELYGKVQEIPQKETTPFYPRSPYAVAKLYGYWITVNYREAYNMYACNGILFNHEGPTRGETFVTRKITRAVAAIHLGLQDKLFVGNINSKRDWGHSRDYVEGMWRILQQDTPEDFVLATGETHEVREFIELAFLETGVKIEWQGTGVDEKGVDANTGRVLIEIDPRYFRPTEVDLLIGDPTKAREKLGWQHKIGFGQLVKEMVAADLKAVEREKEFVNMEPTKFSLKGKKVWVAGHRGMVGSAIVRRLAEENCEVLTVGRDQVNLCRQDSVEKWVEANKPDAVFVAAAKVGGIWANSTRPAEFIYENLAIETNIIHASYLSGVKKLCFLGSSCIYPRMAPQPMSEDALMTGPLEPTNSAYAIAKITGIMMCQAYRKQYGCDYISAMPTNLFGAADNYDPKGGHVVAALIQKAHEAKMSGAKTMELWGTGTPLREFLYVDDLADALVFLTENYSGEDHINVGTGAEHTIRQLAETIAKVVGFEGEFIFDTTKPDGMPRKLMDNKRLNDMGWTAKTSLEDGLKVAYDWYVKNVVKS